MTLSINAGASATAAYLNSITQQNVVKPNDESVTSSTTLQNDNALVLPVIANAAYIVTCALDYEGGTAGASDLKIQWAFPSGATIFLGVAAYLGTDAAIHGASSITAASAFAVGTATATNHRALLMSGSLVTSSTAGNLQLTWAQNTSSATATIVHKGSVLTLQRSS